MQEHKDPAFKTLTKRERKLLNLDRDQGPFQSPTHRLAEQMTKGTDKKKLEKELKRLDRAEWE